MHGIEMRGDGTATTDQDVQRFSKAILDDITTSDPKQRLDKFENALRSLEKLRNHLEKEDIPDFQVTYSEKDGRILTIDPGQKAVAQSGTKETDRGRVDTLIKDLVANRSDKTLVSLTNQLKQRDNDFVERLNPRPKLW